MPHRGSGGVRAFRRGAFGRARMKNPTAARHYDERGLAARLRMIATANVCNHGNVATRRVAGAWG